VDMTTPDGPGGWNDAWNVSETKRGGVAVVPTRDEPGVWPGGSIGAGGAGRVLGRPAMIATWATEPDPADGARSGPGGGTASTGAHGGYEDLAARGTFDSLLRSLLSWELVTQCVDGIDGEDGEWRLSDVAQRRLSELQPAVPRLDERTVYFGHACVDCHQRRPTRLTDGVYRCETCTERRRMVTASAGPAGSDAREAVRHGQLRSGLWEWRLHRRHTGSDPTTDGVGDQRTSA